MKSSVRIGTAALAATVLLLAGCAGQDDAADDAATEPDQTQTEQSEPSGPTEVPDVTILILETAQGNLERAGLEVEVVDEAGEAVVVDDATSWTVTAQDPAEGTVEPGDVVTLTVKERG